MAFKKKNLLYFIFIFLILVSFQSCKKDEKKVYKIGLISGLGGFEDHSFNQSAINGFTRAYQDFNLITETKESLTMEDLSANIKYFGDRGFDLVITLGFYLAEPVQTGAATYPDMDFLIIDYVYPSIPDNVICATYAVDEASFPIGVLAAYWSWAKDPMHPVAGFIAGPDTNIMKPFAAAYINGIKYFNDHYHTDVDYAGYYASSFSDSVQGAQLAESIIANNSVDVIYPFAGKTGNGSLAKVKEKGKWAIGVDVDQYYSMPQVKDILLTSGLKKIDNTVYDIISKYINGTFEGGKSFLYNLDNDGVGLAPYHDYETQIPDSIKVLITDVMQGIKEGSISTGVK
ncbi:MAG: BMP family ABC transporter substrate-binding protein [Bacteroidales bacterium]